MANKHNKTRGKKQGKSTDEIPNAKATGQSEEEILQDDKFSILRATKSVMHTTLVFGVVMTFIIICISSIHVTSISMQEYNWHIRSAAWAGVATVAAEEVPKWLETRQADAAWNYTNKMMQRMVHDFGLDYAYLCVVDPPDYTHITYIFNPVSEDTSFTAYPLGHEQDYLNKQYQEGTKKVFEKGQTVVRYVMHDKSGKSSGAGSGAHITANVPVCDSDGKIVAMLGVRKSMMDFVRLRTQLSYQGEPCHGGSSSTICVCGNDDV